MSDNIINPIEMLYDSKCYTCKYRLTRLIEPATQDDIDYYMEAIDMEPDDAYDIIIEQHKCLITDEDLDGIVRECNKYTPNRNSSLIRDYKF